MGKLSKMDWLVRRSLYWPDGKRKKLTKSQVSETTRKGTSHLLQALVDKYNDEHNLLGVLSLSGCIMYFALIHVSIADPTLLYFRIFHMNSKISCNARQFMRIIFGTSISISLPRLKELMVLTPPSRIYFLLNWHIWKEMNWPSAVCAWLILMLMVIHALLLI